MADDASPSLDAEEREREGTHVAREESVGGDEEDGESGSEQEGTTAPEREADESSEDEASRTSDRADETAPEHATDPQPPSDGDEAGPPTAEAHESEPPVDAPAPPEGVADDVPEDVRKYERFKKMDGATYERVNGFLRDRTHITAREWAIARLCSDFRTETGVEMTKIGENLPELVPFMTDTYSPQAVNQARSSFEGKVRKAGATFLYGAMCNFFTAEELDDVMYEVTEVAKFLLEVEGVDLTVDEELEAEDRISNVMRDVRSASDELRHESTCPNCGHELSPED